MAVENIIRKAAEVARQTTGKKEIDAAAAEEDSPKLVSPCASARRIIG